MIVIELLHEAVTRGGFKGGSRGSKGVKGGLKGVQRGFKVVRGSHHKRNTKNKKLENTKRKHKTQNT
jgi:hypothetical protein